MSGLALALVAIATVASLLLVWDKSIKASITIYALQAACVGSVVFLIALPEGGWEVYLGAVAIIAKALVLPVFLNAVINRMGIRLEAKPRFHTAASLLIGVGLIWFGFMVLQGVTTHSESAGLALGQALVGLWLVAGRRKALSQVLGLMVAENGASLLMSLLAGGQTLLIESLLLIEAVAVPVALAILSAMLYRGVGSTDTGRLVALSEVVEEEG